MFAYCNNNPVVLCDTQGAIPAYSVMMTDGGDGTIIKPDASASTNAVIEFEGNTKNYYVKIMIEYQASQRVPHPDMEVVRIPCRWDAIQSYDLGLSSTKVSFTDDAYIPLKTYPGKRTMHYGSSYVIDVQGKYAFVTVELYPKQNEMYAQGVYDILYGIADSTGGGGGYAGSSKPWELVPK